MTMQTRPSSVKVNRILFALCFLFFYTDGFSTVYYVSSTGNDSNPGTSIAGAWATINKVNNTVFLPGDELYFEGGKTFAGNINLGSDDANDPDEIFVISSYGIGRAIINGGSSHGFYAYNTQGFSISNLIFDGNSMLTNSEAGIMIYADLPGDIKFRNITLSGLEVKNFGAQGVKISSWNHLTGYQNLSLDQLSVHDVRSNGIQIFGDTSQSVSGLPHNHVTVTHCEVYNVPGYAVPSDYVGNGIVVAGVDDCLIEYCVAHDNGQNNSHCGGPGGIWCLYSNNVTVQYCESYRNHKGTGCDGLGFDLDGGVTNSVLQYNYSHENDGAGYLLGQYENAPEWSNNTVRYNISENDGVANQGSIGFFKGPGTTMSGANIYNNTIYVSPQAGNNNLAAVYFVNWTTGINNISFYNNIFFSTGNVPFISVPNGYSAFFAGNIFWTAGGSLSIYYHGVHYTSLDSWRAATGNERVNGVNTGSTGDPLLTNPGGGGTIGFGNSLKTLNAYKISNLLSSAANAALNLGSLGSIDMGTNDFWGTALPGGISNDIGANQHKNVVLPVKLLGFYGNCSVSGQNLFWASAEETDLESYELEFSGDGIGFSRLADILPKGSHSAYHFVNELTSPGNYFYKLKMTDHDGAVTYSPVVQITCGLTGKKMMAGPNPFSQTFNVFLPSLTGGTATLELYNVQGKMVSRRIFQLQKGDNQIPFERLDDLPAGSYYLRIGYEGKSEYLKMLKTGE